MTRERNRTATFDALFTCPSCDGQHRATGSMELRRQPVLFGGAAGTTQTETSWAGPVTCPRTGERAECLLVVSVLDGEYVHRLTVADVIDTVSTAPAAPRSGGTAEPLDGSAAAVPDGWITTELAEWRKNSIATARTFSTTMLTTSSAAVAVYFGVLKYLGYETAPRSWGWATVLPPALFLAAAAAHALALHPTLGYVRAEDYAPFRARRIAQIHTRATIGTALYVLGLLLSLVIFFAVLS